MNRKNVFEELSQKNFPFCNIFSVKIEHAHCIIFERYRNDEKGISITHNPITLMQPLLTF